MSLLEINNLNVLVENKKVLSDINLSLNEGEVVVLMGPNGAGKSSISNAIVGNPKYKIQSGEIKFENENILELDVHERTKKGIFMTFQNPVEVQGVTMTNFLRTAYNSLKGTEFKLGEFSKFLSSKMEEVNMEKKFKSRFVNYGFSGGEKKRSEILQLILFEPKLAILDEIDSGLDVDSLKLISKIILDLKKKNNMGVLIITHQNKILDSIKPDKVYVMKNGHIEKEGNFSLAKQILENGFKK